TTEEKESAAAGLKTEEKGEGRQPAVTGSRGGLASRTEMAADGCSDGRATAPQIWTGSGAVLLRGGLRTEEENGKKGSAASCGTGRRR
ncbi:hypothetical protein CSA_007706, partial [Cucumis sativus]